MKTLLLILAVALLNVIPAVADQSTPANIDVSKFSEVLAAEVIFICGNKLINETIHLINCEQDTPACDASMSKHEGKFIEKKSNSEYDVYWHYNLFYGYETKFGYNGKDDSKHSISINANIDKKINAKVTPLETSFFEAVNFEKHSGKNSLFSADLISDSNMPILKISKNILTHCQYDNWGNQNCEPNTYEYKSAAWVLGDNYSPVANWKNSKTGVIINKKVNFQDYINCIESGLK